MIWSLSPSRSVVGQEGGGSRLELIHQGPDRIREAGRRGFMRRGSLSAEPRHFGGDRPQHNPSSVADAAIAALAPLGDPALRERANARLKELIARDTEEIGDPVEVFNREFPARFLQDFTDPALALAAPLCQVLAALLARQEQGVDVVLDQRVGSHRRIKCCHVSTWHAVQNADKTRGFSLDTVPCQI